MRRTDEDRAKYANDRPDNGLKMPAVIEVVESLEL